MQALRRTAFALAALSFSACSTINTPLAEPTPPPPTSPLAEARSSPVKAAPKEEKYARAQAQAAGHAAESRQAYAVNKMMAAPSVCIVYLPTAIPAQDREN